MTGPAILPLISADTHVNEPHDLWYERLPESMRDLAPRQIQASGDGGWDLMVNGEQRGWGVNEDARIAALAPEARFEVMREDGIAGECIFPTIGLYVWSLTDAEVGRASCELYNDWIFETLESKSARFRCAGVLPTWDVSEAVAEAERIADMGLAAAMLPLVGTPEYNDKSWEPVWEVLEDRGLPAVMHQGTGHNMVFYRGAGSAVSNLMATQSMAPRTAALLATSGVLDRHPELHFVLVEVNAGWLAWAMQTLDSYTDGFREYGWIKPELPEKPSFYLARQLHATFQYDPVAIAARQFTGVSPLLWGSDYPHDEGTYPHSRRIVEELCEGLDGDDAAQVFGQTAARLFGFDPDVLTTPV